MTRASLVVPILLTFAAACGEAPPPPAPATASTAPAPPTAADVPVVVFLGDSLTAGLGLDEERAFPAVIERRLAEAGTPIRAVNAGVSGDTSAGGLRRLGWLLRQEPDVVVVSLGANDGLRALDVQATEENLRRIVTEARAAGARVLLTGMLVPPNYGPDYAERFRQVYPRLAAELGVPLVPFLLEGVAAVPELNQGDGIHPNAAGQERVAEVVLPYLKGVLADADGQARAQPATGEPSREK